MIDLGWDRHKGLANIGVSCGPSGLVVLDGDKRGELDRWCVTYGVALPDTYAVTTGRGDHLYFRWDHSIKRIGNSPKAMEGFKVDVRGEGGYAVAEGSQHASGAVYTGNGRPIADLPDPVAELLLAHSSGEDTEGPNWEKVDPNTAKIGFGDRHGALVSYAGRLRKSGLDLGEVDEAFRQRWLLCEQPQGQVPEAPYHSSACPYPVTWEEARAKLQDVFERYPAGQGEGGEGGQEAAKAAHEFQVAEELRKLRIRQDARQRLAAENRPASALPPVAPFVDWIERPINPIRYRIDRLAPADARTLLSAQNETGKTTLIENLVRALVDDEPFLGYFAINTPASHLVLIDNELDEDMLREWMRAQSIRNTTRIAEVVALRGRVSSFNFLDDHVRDQWVRRLRDLGCDYRMLDCLRPVLDACGRDESHDAGTLLLAYDELLSQAGVGDSTVVHTWTQRRTLTR